MTKAANLALVGSTITPDSSGNISISGKKFQAGGVTTNALAWVNFDGTASGTITSRANYNVGSVTKNGTGDYTLNFTSALADANYCAIGTCSGNLINQSARCVNITGATPTTSALRIATVVTTTNTNENELYINVAVFGN